MRSMSSDAELRSDSALISDRLSISAMRSARDSSISEARPLTHSPMRVAERTDVPAGDVDAKSISMPQVSGLKQ